MDDDDAEYMQEDEVCTDKSFPRAHLDNVILCE